MSKKSVISRLLAIEVRDGELQDSREGDPSEIRDVDEGDPFYVWINRDKRPDEGREDEDNVDGGKIVILQTELEVGEGEIENEIENERQCHHERHFPFRCHPEDLAKRNGDHGVEQSPYGTEQPARWRPCGFE